jgi:DNA-binding NarL/FixJ family response regulator
MSSTPPTVLLGDDHPMNTALLRSLLVPTFDVVADVADGRALIAQAERLSPDVIVTDIGMPELDGIEAARCILAKNQHARIVFVTVHNELEVVQKGLATGALGYVLKLAAGDELVPAIFAALRGERHVAGIPGMDRHGTLSSFDEGASCK